MKADFVIAGSGLFGATFAREAVDAGYSVVVFDARKHTGGNCHSTRQHGIDVHTYGPHIFNTNSKELWDYANRFAKFREYWHRVVAMAADDRPYPFPINDMTLLQVIDRYGNDSVKNRPCEYPKSTNFEAYCVNKIGRKLYELFYREYTRKQWGREPDTLPASFAARIPVRGTFNDRFHDAVYSGVPEDGYANWMSSILDGVKVHLDTLLAKDNWENYGRRLVWSGSIDQYFAYDRGRLEYRTLRFDHQIMPVSDFQGVAQVNYCGTDVPWTRVVEHKHFNPRPLDPSLGAVLPEVDNTVVTYEYPEEWTTESGTDRYYPVRTERNNVLYDIYAEHARGEKDVIFGGRLGRYLYLNMDQTIAQARTAFRRAIT